MKAVTRPSSRCACFWVSTCISTPAPLLHFAHTCSSSACLIASYSCYTPAAHSLLLTSAFTALQHTHTRHPELPCSPIVPALIQRLHIPALCSATIVPSCSSSTPPQSFACTPLGWRWLPCLCATVSWWTKPEHGGRVGRTSKCTGEGMSQYSVCSMSTSACIASARGQL